VHRKRCIVLLAALNFTYLEQMRSISE
jgi:hypothetical protein